MNISELSWSVFTRFLFLPKLISLMLSVAAVLLLRLASGAKHQKAQLFQETKSEKRTIGAWTAISEAASKQIQNKTFASLIDTVYINGEGCGIYVRDPPLSSGMKPELFLNRTVWQSEVCQHFLQVCYQQEIDVQLWILLNNNFPKPSGGDDRYTEYDPIPYSVTGGGPNASLYTPEMLEANAQHFIESVVKVAKEINTRSSSAGTDEVYVPITGFNWDMETETAPRANLHDYKLFHTAVDRLATALREALPLVPKWINRKVASSERAAPAHFLTTLDVQAMFGIEDTNGVYIHGYPGLKDPWLYKSATDPASYDAMAALLASSKVDNYLVMDTYYFSLSRYLDALDWYVSEFPLDRLTIAVAVKAVNPYLKTEDDFLHTENFVLIDKNGHIRGIYNGLNPNDIIQLIANIKTLKNEK